MKNITRPRVGIPRGLLFYHYLPLWQTFFEELGCEVIKSPTTNKEIVEKGIRNCVDEACFPVKIFTGHVLQLVGKVDYIFLPRLVSVQKRTYMCPKILGLPDMIRCGLPNLPQFISPDINLHPGQHKLYPQLLEVGRLFGKSPRKIMQAYNKASFWLALYRSKLEEGMLSDEALDYVEWARGNLGEQARILRKMAPVQPAKPADSSLCIGVVSQPYNLYDSYASMDLLKLLRKRGVKVLTPENLPSRVIAARVETLPKQLFWSMGRRLLGSGLHFLERQDVDGVIHLASFGCGPDSFTGELIEREFRRRGGGRFLNLTVDEHTGEAGLVTRIEAFLDMLQRRVACE